MGDGHQVTGIHLWRVSRAAAEHAAEARKTADRLACEAWNKRMLGFQGPAQPSPALGDALNAGYLYLEVKCLGCNTHQTVALNIVRRPKITPVHELERYMRCAGLLDHSPGCLDRKPITAALNPAGSRTGPSWLTVESTICNAPGTHLLIASLIITYDVCVFSPRMTSVGWVKFVSISHVMFGGGGAANSSGMVRALSSHIAWNA